MDQDPTYDRRASEALAVTLGTGDKTKLISKALYGPERWPVGRPRDARSKLLTGALAAKERVHWWPVEPWFQHHRVPFQEGLRVISWFGHGERLGNCTVQHVVDTFQITDWDFDKIRGVYRHAFSNILPLEPSLHVSCDILVKAIQEARDGMPIPAGNIHMDTWRWAPAGVVEDTMVERCLALLWWPCAHGTHGGASRRRFALHLRAARAPAIQRRIHGGSTGVLRRAHDRRDDLGTRRGRFERRVIRV